MSCRPTSFSLVLELQLQAKTTEGNQKKTPNYMGGLGLKKKILSFNICQC